MKKIMLACFMQLATQALLAQTTTDTLKNIELPASVVRAISLKLFLPQCNSTIKKGKGMDRFNQTQDLPFLLNEFSSIVTTSDAGTGTGYTGIRIRGTDLTRINVSMNGVPVNDPESQATYFVNTPDLISSMQEVEITKGIGNSKNGNGSFGGAISMNTIDVADSNAGGNIEINLGSFNTWRSTTRVTTGLINKKFVATLRASNLTSDGYIDRSAAKLQSLQFTTKYIINPSSTLIFNYLKGREKTGLAWNGILQDSLTTNRTFNPLGIKSDGTFYTNQTDNYGQDYYQLFYDKTFNKHLQAGATLFYTKGKGYYEEFKIQENYSSYFLPNYAQGNDTLTKTDLIRQLWLDNDYYGARLYINYFSKKVDAGLYLNYNEYKGKHFGDVIWAQAGIPNNYKWYDLSAQKNEFNTYGMVDFHVNKNVSLLADAQVRRVDYTINGFRKNPTIQHELNFTFFNPKVKLTYQKGKHFAYAYLGRVTKEPNRDDIEANAINLPKPERLTNLELHYSILLNPKHIIRATAYWMNYKDQLILTGKINDVGAYTRVNVPMSYRLGLELETEMRFKLITVSANLTLSQNKIKQLSEFADNWDAGGQVEIIHRNKDIAFSPNIIAGARVSLFPFKYNQDEILRTISIDLLPKYVGAQYLDNTSNANRKLDAFTTTNLLLNFPIRLKKSNNLIFKAGVNNLFNSMYQSNGYTYSYVYNSTLLADNYLFPQAGRQGLLGVRVEF